MRVFYSDRYTIPLPPDHRFPVTKYRMLRDELLRQNILSPNELIEAGLPTRGEVLRAHTSEYYDGLMNGTMDPQRFKRIGFPWSRELITRSLASVGGQMAASRAALEDGISGSLAGGTHHAHSDGGEGYCVFNDIAVSALNLLERGLIRRCAIIDLDVHQGNGNSSILGRDPRVFIFSMHGEKNYPFIKVPSTLDIALPDGTDDETFLDHLDSALPRVLDFGPDLVFYQAGVDPLKEDALGKLALTRQGLEERDRRVLQACRSRGIPVSLSLGGGYANPIELTVAAHVGTYRVAKSF